MKIINLALLLLFMSFISSCLSNQELMKIKENSEECIVMKTSSWLSTKATVKNNTSYVGLLGISATKIKSNDKIVSSLLHIPLGEFKNGKLYYGILFENISNKIQNGSLRIKSGFFTENYIYSKACSKREAALGASGIIYDEENNRSK